MDKQNNNKKLALGVTGTIVSIVLCYLIYQVIIKPKPSPCDKIYKQSETEISSNLNLIGQEGKIIIGEKNLSVLTEASTNLALNLQSCCIMQDKFTSEELLKCMEIANGKSKDFGKVLEQIVTNVKEIKNAEKENDTLKIENNVKSINQNFNSINNKIESDPSLAKERLQTIAPVLQSEINKSPDDKSQEDLKRVETEKLIKTSDPKSPSSTFPKIQPNLGINDPNNFLMQFQRNRTDELQLSKLGKEAFFKQDYEWSKNFFRQCKIIRRSGVWMSNYPFYAGDYFLTNMNDSAMILLNEMYSQIGQVGFLSHSAGLGMLLKSLGDVRSTLIAKEQIDIIDQFIEKVEKKKMDAD